MVYFGFVCIIHKKFFVIVYRHSLEVLVGPVQPIRVTAVVLKEGGGSVSVAPKRQDQHRKKKNRLKDFGRLQSG